MKGTNQKIMDRVTQTNAFSLWGKDYKSVQRWMTKIQRKDTACFDLYRFCEWAGKSPEELLTLKEDPRNMDAEMLLDDFKMIDDYTPSVKQRILINVKSFFKANYRPVATKSGVVEDYVKEKPYHKISKSDLHKVWMAAFNPRDRFVLDLTFSAGIARETITKMKWGHLEDGWEKQRIIHISLEPEIIKGHGRGKYKGVRQETFITPSAKEDLLQYKYFIEEKIGRNVTKDDPLIFTTERPFGAIKYNRIGDIFRTLQKRSRILISPHDGRRYVENALENANIHINRCRKIRGRKVRGEEAPYSQPAIEELRIDYAKVLGDLEFQITQPTIKPEDIRREIINVIPDEDIEPTARKFGISIAEARHILSMRESAFKELWSERRKKTMPNGGTDCDVEYKEVNENDLLMHLRTGWKIIHNLQNGRVIISKG